MDEPVAKPWIFVAIEALDGPIDQLLDPRYFLRIRMIGEPDIELELEADIKRYQRVTKRRNIGWQPAYAGALRDRPKMGGGDIVAHRHEAELFATRIFIVQLLAPGLVRILKDNAMILTDIVRVFRHAVDFNVGRTHERHDVKPPDLDSHQVGLVGLFELHGDVGFETKYVGRTHLAFQIHQKARIGPLKFNQPW